jgi:type VI protein secretion system component VasF
MNKLPQAAITPLLITFWSLSFAPDAAAALRTNTELLEKIQTISKATQDEGLKKAADGLVWKLIKGKNVGRDLIDIRLFVF